MVKIVFLPDEDRAVAYDGEKIVGKCAFFKALHVWFIDHTVVDENYGGQGIAKNLVVAVIEAARKNNVKIVPLCSYAKRVFDTTSDYADVLN